MSDRHKNGSKRLKKIIKKLNPFDLGGEAVDIITSAGRPTAGLSLPGIGPSIKANNDEALAEQLKRDLPKDWDVEEYHTYYDYVRHAKSLGLDDEDAVEFAKSDYLREHGHPDYQGADGPPKHLQKSADDKRYPQAKEPKSNGNPKGDAFPVAMPPKLQTAQPSQQDQETVKPKTEPMRIPAPSTAAPENNQGKENSFPVPLPPQPKAAPQPQESRAPADPRVAEMTRMAAAPVEHPGKAALLKPVEKLTEGEMKDMIHSAQSDFRGWKSGDPLKAHTYEKVQDWHSVMYGDKPQANDGGKPVEPQPIRPIPDRPSPHSAPDGGDLWQASAEIGQHVARAADADGYTNAVKSLQRGLNTLNQTHPLPARSPAYAPYTPPAPLKEDGRYGPVTDFTLKQAVSRLGPDKVAQGFDQARRPEQW